MRLEIMGKAGKTQQDISSSARRFETNQFVVSAGDQSPTADLSVPSASVILMSNDRSLITSILSLSPLTH